MTVVAFIHDTLTGLPRRSQRFPAALPSRSVYIDRLPAGWTKTGHEEAGEKQTTTCRRLQQCYWKSEGDSARYPVSSGQAVDSESLGGPGNNSIG